MVGIQLRRIEKKRKEKICRKARPVEKVLSIIWAAQAFYSCGSGERAVKKFRICHPLWPIDYFELKALEKQQVPEGLSALALPP